MTATLPEGWYQTGTGGGCTALQRDLEPIPAEGGDPAFPAYALITDAEDTHTAPRSLDGRMLIAFYVDGDQGDNFEGSLAECLAWLDSTNRTVAIATAIPRVRCQDLDQDTHEAQGYEGALWEGSLADFLEGNVDSPDVCAEVSALAVGASTLVGGGASPLTRVERLS